MELDIVMKGMRVFYFMYIVLLFSPPELQFYTSAAAVVMLIPAWAFLMVSQLLFNSY